MSQGRVEEAIVILKKLERSNGTTVPPGVYQQFEVNWFFRTCSSPAASYPTSLTLRVGVLQDSCLKLKKQEDADKTYSVLDLFRSPRMRNTTILLVIIW